MPLAVLAQYYPTDCVEQAEPTHRQSGNHLLTSDYIGAALPPQSNSLDWFRQPLPFGSMPEDSSTPQRRRRRIGCHADVCNETVAKKALMSGSFAGLRPGFTGRVFTTIKLSVLSSKTLMKTRRRAPQWRW